MSEAAPEIDGGAVLDHVVLPLESLEPLRLHLPHRARRRQVVEGGHLGPDKPLGEIGVNLAGGIDGAAATLEVPSPYLGLAGREEGDDPHGVVGLADDPVAAEL